MAEDIDIKSVFRKALYPGKAPGQLWTDKALWGSLYDHGFVDPRRLPKERWMDILKQLPEAEGRYAMGKGHLDKIAQFLYAGPIKRPFDPQRLKDGLRPTQWIQEMYQKVLKFETNIKQAEWNLLVREEINLNFMEKGQYNYDQDFKDFLSILLEERASPLRKLELWAFRGGTDVAPTAPVQALPQAAPKAGGKPAIQDRFDHQPEELKKIRSIEKLYYHAEKGPAPNDKETLDFLNELEDMGDEGDELK